MGSCKGRNAMKQDMTLDSCLKIINGHDKTNELFRCYTRHIQRYYPKVHHKATNSVAFLKCRLRIANGE